jgi:aryl-alcohol dehydrogenase-like predicted oxidoreductase
MRLILGSADLKDDRATVAVLDHWYAAGGRTLDLANVYGEGESERAVGRWLADDGRRAEFTLLVKGCHPPFCDAALVGQEVEVARSTLGVDALDVFVLHRDDPSTRVEAFAEALMREVDRGTIGAFGVSNWELARFEALRLALGADAGRLTVFSNHFSLAEMVEPTWPGCLAMSKADLAALREHHVIGLAWASLAGGYFAGRALASWDSQENEARRARAAELARRRGTTTPGIAVAYVLAQGPNVRPVVGTVSTAHLSELISAAELTLEPDELAWLDRGAPVEERR